MKLSTMIDLNKSNDLEKPNIVFWNSIATLKFVYDVGSWLLMLEPQPLWCKNKKQICYNQFFRFRNVSIFSFWTFSKFL